MIYKKGNRNMKKRYEEPEATLIMLCSEDVITNSGYVDGGYGEVEGGDEDLG